MTYGEHFFTLLQQLDSFIGYLEYCPSDRKFHLLDIIARLRAEMREIEELTQIEKNRPMKFIKVIIESGLNVE